MCCLVIQHLDHLPALWALCHELHTGNHCKDAASWRASHHPRYPDHDRYPRQGREECLDWSALAADFFASCWLRQDSKKRQLPSTLWTKMLRLQSTPEWRFLHSGGFWPFDLVCLLAGSLFKLFVFLFVSFFVLCDFSILLIFPCWGN